MIKKLALLPALALLCMLILIQPNALANSYDSVTTTVLIDTAPVTSLQVEIESLLSVSGHTKDNITVLTIAPATAYELTAADIDYIKSMTGLAHLITNTNVSVQGGDVGDSFFNNNDVIQSVTFPGKIFGNYAFYSCDSLTSVNLFEAQTFNDYAFESSNKITSVSLPNVISFGYDAFFACYYLETISFPKCTSFGDNAFIDCHNLSSVSLPECKTFGDSAFQNNISLTEISLPKAETFGDMAFRFDASLKTVDLPSAKTFGNAAFRSCTSIVNIDLPSAEKFASYSFYSCTSLRIVSLIKVSEMGVNAFSGCTSPITLQLGSTPPTMGGSFGYSFPAGAKLTLSSAYKTSYDNDPNDSSGANDDLRWFGWPMDVIYVVSYNSNGGAGMIPGTSHRAGDTAALSDGTGFTKDGKSPLFWNTKSDGTGTQYALSSSLTVPDADVLLYAIYNIATPTPTPTVTPAPTTAPTAKPTTAPKRTSSKTNTPAPTPSPEPSATPTSSPSGEATTTPAPAISETPIPTPAQTPPADITTDVVSTDDGKTVVNIDVTSLPQGTSAVKLPSGQIVPIDTAENGMLTIEVFDGWNNEDGSITLVMIGDDEVALGTYNIVIPQNAEKTAKQGFPIWVFFLVGAVIIFWILYFTGKKIRKDYNSRNKRI